MFDLIIANPPYGRSSSLSKKIVNVLLENKVAEEYVVLAPPRSFLDTLDKIVEFENKGLTSDLFDIPTANGIRVYCTKYTNNEINKYSEFDLRFYDKKLKQLAEAVHSYNKEHETFIDTDYEYGGLSWKTLNYLSAEIKKGLDPNRIFLIPYFTPRNGVQWGECGDHNNGVKLWDFDEHPTQQTMKKIGWVSELQKDSSLIHIAYDTPDIQQGALFIVPSGLDDGKGRLFRCVKLTNSIVYPASIACEIVPEYGVES